jgi:dihydrolipoamide dehydrogenase
MNITNPAKKKLVVVVLGSGPGGYTAAFRMADLGKALSLELEIILIERYTTLGGVCLNVGCIPSKALLHIAKVLDEANSLKAHGIDFGKPKMDLPKLQEWKNSVVKKLTTGLSGLARKRKVKVVQGTGTFKNENTLTILNTQTQTQEEIFFDYAIIAAGSESTQLPCFTTDLLADPRLMSSTGALQLEEIPKKLLIIGGGIIGLEMATVYHALGSQITVAEFTDRIMPGVDPDMVQPLYKRLSQEKGYQFLLNHKVSAIQAKKQELLVHFEAVKSSSITTLTFDRILYAVGRTPNGRYIGAEQAGITVDSRGFIPVDKQLRTNIPHIFAIGDIIGQPMLAHKASAEGHLAAEVIAQLIEGKNLTAFAPLCIPSVAYTDPEIAWVGLTEAEAQAKNTPYQKAVFPWAASGRALGQAREEGKTKLLFHPQNKRILGGSIVGPHAGELIGELALAIEMCCTLEDVALTIHPHPTLAETIKLAAEVGEGTITDL